MSKSKGYFTLPGEAGYEELTLKLAEKWGADVIRDSDGTTLSDDILKSDYDIYSTICIIRDHNEWASKNMDKLQQTFLMSRLKTATSQKLSIRLLDGYFEEQFAVNDSEESIKYWQVIDRTDNTELPRSLWAYSKDSQTVIIEGAKPWHNYTVNFLVYRIWEEISMYNHVTNNWDKEHLMPIDPRHPETQEYLLDWMEKWCISHPHTNVVRFTSMFYNFVWIWGSEQENRSLFTDWASYDFTVSPLALEQFEKEYGYRITSEDFINKGKLHATHIEPDQRKRDWMEFVNRFVVSFGRKLIDIVHKYNKKAYVFYDDSWVGIEPYNSNFAEFGFDGIIKCVFSGFEIRLCSEVRGVEIHEIRLHPYLFPTGLGGEPTFMPGGNPTLAAKQYWNNVRRALLRAPIDRIGLGGYLHLAEPFTDFCDYIEKVSDEFRMIRELHEKSKPYTLGKKIAILTAWGKLRTWTCSGHYHEHPELDLINILESLSGLPFDVIFMSFEDILNDGIPEDVSLIINAGFEGSAWSGGTSWKNPEILEKLTKWVYEGGVFLGVNEPSAVAGYDTTFRMAHVLGIDLDRGERICHGKWKFDVQKDSFILKDGGNIAPKKGLYLTDGNAKVLIESGGTPVVTVNDFGKGRGIYFASYSHNIENSRFILNTVLFANSLENCELPYITDNKYTECSYFPEINKLVIINNSDIKQTASVRTESKGKVTVSIDAYDTCILDLT